MDVVLLYDVFHVSHDREEVLRELHRVLKPEGTLSFSDHHMKQEGIRRGVNGGDLFKLVEKENALTASARSDRHRSSGSIYQRPSSRTRGTRRASPSLILISAPLPSRKTPHT